MKLTIVEMYVLENNQMFDNNKERSAILTLENTAFVSVGAYQHPEIRCRNFIKSAEKFGVPLTWISWGERWQGFNHHKLRLLREKCIELQNDGIEYVFMLDSKDVVFAVSAETILRKAAEIYEPGTLLFNAEWDNHIYPYQTDIFKHIVKTQGQHLNSGMIFGDIEAYIIVIGLALEIIDGIKHGTPRAGLAEQVYNDPTTHRLYEDDQLTYQIASVYHPEYFRLDTDRHLFAWVGVLEKPLDAMRLNAKDDGFQYIGNACLIHSSSTIQFGSQQQWDNWVRENQLVTPAKIKVCQLAFGWQSAPDYWFRYVEAINRLYCERHGYEYVVERMTEAGQVHRHQNWAKVAFMSRHLNDCDYLFFLDADACFYCHELTIHEQILPLLPADKFVLMPVDLLSEHARTSPDKLNTGVIVLRNHQISHQLLQEWDKVSDMPQHTDTRWEWPVEQKAINDYIYPKYQESIHRHVDYYSIQAHNGYFIRHLAGMSDDERHRRFKEIYHSSMMRRNFGNDLPSLDLKRPYPDYYLCEDGRVSLRQLEIDIVSCCNLRCEQCDHLSPYRKGIVPAETIVEWFETWSKKIRPRAIFLLGGEPLLHPDLASIVRETRRIWGDFLPIAVVSNGTLIPQVSHDVFDAIKESGVHFLLTDHSGVDLPRDKVMAGLPHLAEHRVPSCIRTCANNEDWAIFHQWGEGDVPIPFQSVPREAWQTCYAKGCPVIAHNRLYKCSHLAAIAEGVREGALSPKVWHAALTYEPLPPDAEAQAILDHFLAEEVPECTICPNTRTTILTRQLHHDYSRRLDPVLSFVLPVYNVEPYLLQCLDSVVHQTVRDIQIICVNDGSTDGSLAILEEYAAKDARFSVISQENRGAGAARNAAYPSIKGRYTFFADPDDWLALDLAEQSVRRLEATGADVAYFRYCLHCPDGNVLWSYPWESELPSLRESFEERCGLFRHSHQSWDKVWRTEFLIKNDVRFSDNSPFEDSLLHWKGFVLANKIALLNAHLYHHRQSRPGSYCTALDRNSAVVIDNVREIGEALHRLGRYEEFRDVFETWNTRLLEDI